MIDFDGNTKMRVSGCLKNLLKPLQILERGLPARILGLCNI
ncbi:hypothetical protein ACKLNO_05295 [Neisseriaceae bacterium B1]